MDDQTTARIRAEIHRVLLEVWDPIGVKDVPNAQDEYDRYIEDIYHLLRGRQPADKIVDYLYKIETERMGLPEHDRASLDPVIGALRKVAL